ncbi:Rho-binding antiterminator [Microscilla marina]|uniref:Rho-binding antiterminator n=1 Tax=Microscilla marina ATCC 23134 TaxID=313606 RepID=A1ZYH1_MICM2|nr:Rho-binding antiterminator [Microscilla marina]EAY24555.1 conserved hypothetical protein [Microscilla marina ATCC 23134]
MNKAKPYNPINCSLYDYLEAWAVTQTPCKVTYLDAQNKEAYFTKTIVDLYIKDKVEYVKWNDGSSLRLDQLIEINGVRFWGMTC